MVMKYNILPSHYTQGYSFNPLDQKIRGGFKQNCFSLSFTQSHLIDMKVPVLYGIITSLINTYIL